MAVPDKIVLHGVDARDRIFAGAMLVVNVVRRTLGPWGANALIEKGHRVTNDGVSIAKEIRSNDEVEQLGVERVVEVAVKTNDEAGDGTTTAITLAGALLTEAAKHLPKDRLGGKLAPSEVVRRIKAETKEVTEQLIQMATPIETEEQLIKSAIVSVDDEKLGTLIGKAQFDLGKEGYIIVEDSNQFESTIEKVSGLYIDNGFGTSAIVNRIDKEALETDEVNVIYTNHTFTALEPIVPLLEELIRKGSRKIVIMARAYTNECIQECLEKLKIGLYIYPLNAPYTDQAEIMGDLQAVLGGKFINSETTALQNADMTYVGFAQSLLAKRANTIISGAPNEETTARVQERLTYLQEKLTGEVSQFERRNLNIRIAQLENGFALLRIGAVTDTERLALKDKAEDAVNAVRAAFQEGTVPGAGLALKEIADKLPDTYIIKNALSAPYEQIKSTMPEGETIPDWVRDPLKVIRVALEKAASIAAVLATTEIAIVTKKERPRLMQEVQDGD